MRLVLACNTLRGVQFLRRLRELCPTDEIHVATSLETPGEPPYNDALIEAVRQLDCVWINYAGQLAIPDGTDLLMLVNWRRWVDPRTYAKARTAVCFHDSLLPKYRGFYPAVWAMLNGDRLAGVSLFHLAPGIDAGPIIDQAVVSITLDDTIADLIPKLTQGYLTLLEVYIERLKAGDCEGWPQVESAATYTCQRVRADDEIDWNDGAATILRKIRALTYPYQGAWTTVEGRGLVIWRASHYYKRYFEGSVAGAVVSRSVGKGAVVLTGHKQALYLEEVQEDGGVRKPAGSVLDVPGRLGY